MMTVLQIIPSLGAGGAEQACVDIALGLKAAGHTAIVVSSGGRRVQELDDNGVIHIQHDVKSKNPITIFRNVLWLTNLIRERRIDIIHARSRAPAWSALIASHRAPCHFVTTFHAAYKYSNRFKKLYNSVMTCGELIIAISEFIAKNVRDDYEVPADRIRVIPRGIDLDAYETEKVTEERRAQLLEIWKVKADQPIILMPARITPIKGQKILIEAMATLAASPHKPVAVIIGDDQGRVEYRQELDALIEKHQLKDNVRIVNHSKDMPAAYSLASIVAAPSLVPEGFGRVPIESMAMGVPVVASELGGYAENIRNGETGWLVPPNNAQKLAEAILQIFDLTPEERKKITEAAMKNVRLHFDKRAMVSDTLKVYEDILNPPPSVESAEPLAADAEEAITEFSEETGAGGAEPADESAPEIAEEGLPAGALPTEEQPSAEEEQLSAENDVSEIVKNKGIEDSEAASEPTAEQTDASNDIPMPAEEISTEGAQPLLEVLEEPDMASETVTVEEPVTDEEQPVSEEQNVETETTTEVSTEDLQSALEVTEEPIVAKEQPVTEEVGAENSQPALEVTEKQNSVAPEKIISEDKSTEDTILDEVDLDSEPLSSHLKIDAPYIDPDEESDVDAIKIEIPAEALETDEEEPEAETSEKTPAIKPASKPVTKKPNTDKKRR